MDTLKSDSESREKAVLNDDFLAVFDGLPKNEQRAWLGWFAGGKSFVIKWGENPGVNFGKHECEQVDFDAIWLGKFVELGWLTVREERRFKALGMVGQPESVEYELRATDLGWNVREGYWERLKSRSANSPDQPSGISRLAASRCSALFIETTLWTKPQSSSRSSPPCSCA